MKVFFGKGKYNGVITVECYCMSSVVMYVSTVTHSAVCWFWSLFSKSVWSKASISFNASFNCPWLHASCSVCLFVANIWTVSDSLLT